MHDGPNSQFTCTKTFMLVHVELLMIYFTALSMISISCSEFAHQTDLRNLHVHACRTVFFFNILDTNAFKANPLLDGPSSQINKKFQFKILKCWVWIERSRFDLGQYPCIM